MENDLSGISGNILSLSVWTCPLTALPMCKQSLHTSTKHSAERMWLRSNSSRRTLVWEIWPTWMMLLVLVRGLYLKVLPRMISWYGFLFLVRNNMWDWQSLQVTSGPGTQFFKFCDALEVQNGVQAPAGGFGLDHALAAWGAYWRSSYLKTCKNYMVHDHSACLHSLLFWQCVAKMMPSKLLWRLAWVMSLIFFFRTCLGTYDSTADFYTDTTIDNASRSWMWIV